MAEDGLLALRDKKKIAIIDCKRRPIVSARDTLQLCVDAEIMMNPIQRSTKNCDREHFFKRYSLHQA